MIFKKQLLALLIAIVFTVPIFAEYVFMRDGSIIEGSIVRDEASNIVFRGKDGKVKKIPRAQIMRVLYTKLNMGKVYIQKRDGKGLVAYIVDEDRTAYTFRKELYDPKEFTVERDDVLFIAERNPSRLKGAADTDRVRLEWFSSYDEMKLYNIYLKQKGKRFEVADTAKKSPFVLKGLKSNTEYTARVTGVDQNNDETTPSNDFTFITKNIPPERPGKTAKQLDKTGALRISWEAARDVDGRVELYRLFAPVDGKRTMVGETGKTEYIVQDAPRYSRVEVVAVDDLGDESRPSSIRVFGSGYTFQFTAGAMLPLGRYGDVSETGFGGSLSLLKHDFILQGLEAGISAGLYRLPGIDDIESDITQTGRALFAPLTFSLGFRFQLGEKVFAIPYLAAGAAFMDMSYTERINSETLEKKQLKAFGPIAGAGLCAEYMVHELLAVGLRVEQGILAGGGLFDHPFLRLEIAAGYRL